MGLFAGLLKGVTDSFSGGEGSNPLLEKALRRQKIFSEFIGLGI
jgi:hypothetical protein